MSITVLQKVLMIHKLYLDLLVNLYCTIRVLSGTNFIITVLSLLSRAHLYWPQQNSKYMNIKMAENIFVVRE